MVLGIWPVVEVGPQGAVINGRAVFPFKMGNGHLPRFTIAPVFLILVDTSVMGIYSTEVGEQVRLQLIIPVECHVHVSPCQVSLVIFYIVVILTVYSGVIPFVSTLQHVF